jgi:alpha-mannosidase
MITKARLFNTPATAVVENNHKGTQADTFCGLAVSAKGVQVSAIKRAEDGQGLIVRVYETEGKETPVEVSGALLPTPLNVTVAPWSIQTYLLKDGESAWKEVLLTEFDI